VSAAPDSLDRLLDSWPLLRSHVTLQSEHVIETGAWAVRKCALATGVPFDVRLPCPPDMIGLIGQLDGTRTVRQLYADLSARGALADDATIDRLASFIHILAAHGMVELAKGAGSD
jgi:hypothetical protein